MRNEIYTQSRDGRRTAYTRYHVGCDALSVFASQMTDYEEEERLAAQEVIAYTADAVDVLVRKGGIITKNRIVRRGIAALDIPDMVRAQFEKGPIADTTYQHVKFPVRPGMRLHMSGSDRVFVLAPFPEDLTIHADGHKALKILTPDDKSLNNWIGLFGMMQKVVGKYYDFRDCRAMISRATIVDNAFADAIVANR